MSEVYPLIIAPLLTLSQPSPPHNHLAGRGTALSTDTVAVVPRCAVSCLVPTPRMLPSQLLYIMYSDNQLVATGIRCTRLIVLGAQKHGCQALVTATALSLICLYRALNKLTVVKQFYLYLRRLLDRSILDQLLSKLRLI
ncbi:hypothetical protein J6590_008398 [Homalodisca vitripennis]|nr:hypothetical protein J6590_008398 [Homalodisca vitripennis]